METPKKRKITLDGEDVGFSGRIDLAGSAAVRFEHSASVLLARTRVPGRWELSCLHGRDRRRARTRCFLHSAASEGMIVSTATDRAVSARKMVFELLVADQPSRDSAHDDESAVIPSWADTIGVDYSSAYEAYAGSGPFSTSGDGGQPGCLHQLYTVCVRACRDVQVNDVIGMAHRGAEAKIVFDFDDPMGDSTCVACGECVQACPTGAFASGHGRCTAGAAFDRTEKLNRSVPTAGSGAS